MGAIASQITSLTIVYSTVYSDADQGKHQSSASLAFVRGKSPGNGEFPAQMASYAENVSSWRRHHVHALISKIVLAEETDTDSVSNNTSDFHCFWVSTLARLQYS